MASGTFPALHGSLAATARHSPDRTRPHDESVRQKSLGSLAWIA
jgi:hypothetical protein